MLDAIAAGGSYTEVEQEWLNYYGDDHFEHDGKMTSLHDMLDKG